ncbi:hypothetical protein L1N85_00150 [Paenibacillus alkaliterrae]|uniref:hypothetical protein n=1 Tax=Paenibacillus alkaliterrae TaxID=320909 RepID=UPI001F303F1C|nr:hypothetical protein [Paenibacillus alkaliterrae]MCF2936838.1 hypothetical protein [Paenibacillus alkaliterrae]
MMYNNEIHNHFAVEVMKLIGKQGLIHLQNDTDYKLVVQRFTGFEAAEFYDDEKDPMIFKISFINESGREDAIEIWDSAIEKLDFTQPEVEEEWVTDGLRFMFAALKDDSNAIEFYGF